MYLPSRFLSEIPEELVDKHSERSERSSQTAGLGKLLPKPGFESAPPINTVAPKATDWKAGERVEHEKWGTGTVVEVRGTGDNQEVKVAFPGMGIRQLLTKFAPLTRI